MKKLFALTLAVLMVVGMLPLAIFGGSAETLTTGVCTIYYQKDGVKTAYGTYDTLDAAFDAMKGLYAAPLADTTLVDGDDADETLANELYAAAGSPVIEINGDFAGAGVRPNWTTGDGDAATAYNPDKIVTFVIEGNNHTITYGSTSTPHNDAVFNYMAYYNITVKNTNFVINRGTLTRDNYFFWNGYAGVSSGPMAPVFTTFENCEITEVSNLPAGSDQGSLFKMTGKAKAWQDLDVDTYNDTFKGDVFNLTFKDTTVTATCAVGIQVHWGADANIKLLNSTFITAGASGGGNNFEAIKFYEAGTIDFYMDGTSKMISQKSSGSKKSVLLRDLTNMGQPVTYTFEEGAQFILDNKAAMTDKAQFIINASQGKVTVNDKGAIFKASATDVNSGVKIPTLVDENGTARVWKAGNDFINGGTYTNANATSDVFFTYERVGANDVCMTVGANGNIIEGYETLNAAVDAVQNNEKIVVFKNIKLTSQIGVTTYDPKHVRTIVIEGAAGTRPVITASNGFAVGMGLYNLTVRNLEINAAVNAPFMWDPRTPSWTWYNNHVGSITFIENCKVTSTGSFMFKAKGGDLSTTIANTRERYFATIKDCDLSVSAPDDFMLNNSSATSDFRFVNTKINYTGGKNNVSVFNINTSSTFKLSFDKDCVINTNVTNTTNANTYVFHNGGEAQGTIVVDLAKGMTINFDGGAGKTDAQIATNHIVINNYGAIFNISETISKLGILLPYNFHNGTICYYNDGTNDITGLRGEYTGTGAVTITTTDTVDSAVGSNKIVNINTGTFYTTLNAASNAATSNQKIVVIGSFTDSTLLADGSKNLSVIGAKGANTTSGNNKITQTNNAYNQAGNSGYKYVIMNLDIDQEKGFWNDSTLFIVDGCNILTKTSMVIRPAGNYNHNIDLVNTTWNVTSQEPVVAATADNDGNGELNLDFHMINSTINNYDKWSNSHDGNTAVFYLRTHGKMNIRLDGTSVINMAPVSGTKGVISSIFTIEAKQVTANTSYTLELEEGAKIAFDTPSQKTILRTFTFNNLIFPIKVIDKGADWVVKTAAASATVTLPVIQDVDGNYLVWTRNGKIVDGAYTQGATTTTFKAAPAPEGDKLGSAIVEFSANGFTTVPFASLVEAMNYLEYVYAKASGTDDALWQAAGSPILTIKKDFALSSTVVPKWWNSYNASKVRTVYIKGDTTSGKNPVISSTVAGAMIRYNAYYNLTIENVDLDSNGGFALFWSGYEGGKNSAKSTTTLKNCNIAATGTASEGLVFKVTGNKTVDSVSENYIINLVNTDVVGKKGVNAVFLFHHGCAGTLNIDGESSIYHTMDKNAGGGDTMFMVGTPRYFNVNIESGATLTSNVVSGYVVAGVPQWDYSIFNIQGSNEYDSELPKLTLNVEDGVNVTINYADGNTFARPACFVRNALSAGLATNAILNIGDGVNFKFNAAAATKGFGIVKGIYETELTDDNLLGYLVTTADGVTKLYDSVVLANKVTQAVTSMVPVYYADGDFTMDVGAALRTIPGESGIRFTSNVANSLITKLAGANSVTYGTIIAKESIRDGGEITLSTLDAKSDDVPVAVNTVHKNGRVEGDYLVNRAALIGIPDTAEAYEIEFAARSYITIEYADGSTRTIYTTFNADENVRSIRTVAENLNGNCAENIQTAVDQVLNIVNGTTNN